MELWILIVGCEAMDFNEGHLALVGEQESILESIAWENYSQDSPLYCQTVPVSSTHHCRFWPLGVRTFWDYFQLVGWYIAQTCVWRSHTISPVNIIRPKQQGAVVDIWHSIVPHTYSVPTSVCGYIRIERKRLVTYIMIFVCQKQKAWEYERVRCRHYFHV